MEKQLDDTVATAIVHVIDRITEFFIKSSATKLVWSNEYEILLQFDTAIRSFWNERGFSNELMRQRSFMANAWDILQCNYCYNRPAAVTHQDEVERAFDYYLPEFLHYFKPQFLHSNFPFLDRLRAADLTNPLDFDSMIQAACGLFSEEFRNLGSPPSNEPQTTSPRLASIIYRLLHRYPIFLNPASRFFFFDPTDVGLRSEHRSLAFGASFDISAEELTEALDDYKFHFLMTRRYFAPSEHISRLDSDQKMMDQLAKSFVGKETRKNKYVSQKNSIAGSLCAMHVWELVHVKCMDPTKAIKQVAEAFGPLGADTRYKKVKDRYRTINDLIDQVTKKYHMENEKLSAR